MFGLGRKMEREKMSKKWHDFVGYLIRKKMKRNKV